MEAHFCLHCGVATPTEPGVPPRTDTTGIVEVSRVKRALADRYRIERILGEGGMATVYLAEDIKHHRKVAVKVMRPELAATLGAERFLREVEIAARLSHPHILPMHDSGEADGLLYYVMPYVPGESLRDRMKREGQLPVEDALRLAREVAEALAYAHEQGIVHRDMKPANVLLSAGHALVADFGIARAVGGDAITQTGLAIGTPQYMSPEQAMGGNTVDGRADIYAVGAVLYEMLAGEPPFTGPNSQAIITRSMTETPRSLTSVRAALPLSLDPVVFKAMAKTPADRYQSARAFADQLDQTLDRIRQGSAAVEVDAPPSNKLIWGLFGIAAAVVLVLVVSLIRRLGLPAWTLTFALALLAAGAAVLVATGRADQRRRTGRAEGGLGRWLTYRNAAVGGILAMVLWAAVASALAFKAPAGGSDPAGGVRLAVLPFENRGNPDDAYFAAGIADEVRGKLAGLGGFQVTARSSSDQYRETTKSPRQIGQELGVDYLLTATVRWAKAAGGTSRVQVVPEVIDVRTGGVAWQQTFDADLTDVFQVQAQIASRVAGAMGVALAGQEQERLTERPTGNLAAYDAYLKGRAIVGAEPAELRSAVRFFDQAVALDSNFADAWARLSTNLSLLYTNAVPDPFVGERARTAAERALRLHPEGAAGHAAVGTYFSSVRRDQNRAAEHIGRATQLAPNDPELLVQVAGLERGTGRWNEALGHLLRSRRLDPRSVRVTNALQNTYLWLRKYPEALEASEAALALAPGDLSISQDKAMIYVAQGDLAGARSVIRQVSPAVTPEALAAFFGTYWDMYWVLDDPLQQVLLRIRPEGYDNDRSTWANVLTQLLWLRGDTARARIMADSAVIANGEVLAQSPDDPQRTLFQGLSLAYQGRKADAIAKGEHALSLISPDRDHVNGPYFQHVMARIYLLAGEPEKALDLLEAILKRPYFVSPGWLRIDPTFAELKGHPRFERLLQEP
jgi:serine/threonine-protein kinase